MDQKYGSQTIIITGNPLEARFQIVIPPFRPINMYELEDDFDEVVEEIKMNVLDKHVSNAMIQFITSFKDSIETETVIPLVEYFIQNKIQGMSSDDMKLVFDSVREYIHYSNDENRAMH